MKHSLTGLAAIMAVGACTVGPDFTPPDSPAPQHWANAEGADTRSDPTAQWWHVFADPVLNQLMAQASAGNLTVQQAIARVVQTRQGEAAAAAAGLPKLGGFGGYQRMLPGTQGLLESTGAYAALNDAANQAGHPNALGTLNDANNLYFYGLDATWQLDLFGRVSRSVEQAQANTQAQAENAADALVTLQADVAQAYFNLRAAQALLAAQTQSLAAARAELELNLSNQRAGLAAEFDTQTAMRQFQLNQQQIPNYEKQVAQARNTLAVLCGQPPGTLDALLNTPAPLRLPPTLITVGVPASLARRRPDIRAAEAQLHAATAAEGVAVASFYPDISLIGALGMTALDANYLTNWASHFYTLGPSISLPIFQGGRLTANLRQSRAQVVVAGLNYRNTVLNALREVEDALVAYRTDLRARDRVAETLRSAETSEKLSRDAWRSGLVPFVQVLDAQRSSITYRQKLIQANLTVAQDAVSLYKALGGGWQQGGLDLSDPPALAPLPPVPAALDAQADRMRAPQPG